MTMRAIPTPRAWRRPWSALVGVLVVAAAGPAAGVDDRVVDEPVGGQEGAVQPHLVDLGANFDPNVFEQRGNGWVLRGGDAGNFAINRLVINGRVLVPGTPRPATGESSSLARIRELGARQVTRVDEHCGLSPAQRRRLELAVESDVRRLAEDVDEVRARYGGVRVDMNSPAGQKQWHQFQQDVQGCRQRMRDLFNARSLFARALVTTLDDGQRDRIEREARARRSFQWRAMVVTALARMDDTLGLGQAQHEALEALLVAREPPLRVDEAPGGREDPHLQTTLVSMVLAGADVEGIRPLFSERQWRSLTVWMNQGRAMRSWIEQQGVLEP